MFYRIKQRPITPLIFLFLLFFLHHFFFFKWKIMAAILLEDQIFYIYAGHPLAVFKNITNFLKINVM